MNHIEDYATAAQHEVSIETFAHILQSVDTWNLAKREYDSDIVDIEEDHPLSELLTPELKTVGECLDWLHGLDPINETWEYLIGFGDGENGKPLTFTIEDDVVLFELY